MSLDPTVTEYDPEALRVVPPPGWWRYFREFFRLSGGYWTSERK